MNSVTAHDDPCRYVFRLREALLGAQMLFVAFGALVLVPLLTGLDSNVAFFTAGVGTLIFQIVTRGKVPIFLASSFAFIAPIMYGVKTWGVPLTMGALIFSGLLYVALSTLIRFRGTAVILRILPPIVTGPVIMVIGLVLAPVAVKMALGLSGDGTQQLIPRGTALALSMSALLTTVAVSLLGRGLLRLVPILCGIAVGLLVALGLGVGNWDAVHATPWFALPDFVLPQFSWEPMLFIIPITVAPAIEHLRHHRHKLGDGQGLPAGSGHQEHHAGRRSGHYGGLRAGRPAQYHLFRSDGRGDADASLQPRRHDVGGHLFHPALLCGQGGGLFELHPHAGHGRDHDPAVRGHHGGGTEHAGAGGA